MKIPHMIFELTSNDLLSLTNKFLNKNNFKITSINLNKEIIINGTFLFKSLKLSFICQLTAESVTNDTISIKNTNFKVINMNLPKTLIDLITKSFLSFIKMDGIKICDNLVILNLPRLLNQFNITNIEVDELKITEEHILLSLKKINISKTLDEIITMVI